jgi:hypothetical protein
MASPPNYTRGGRSRSAGCLDWRLPIRNDYSCWARLQLVDGVYYFIALESWDL